MPADINARLGIQVKKKLDTQQNKSHKAEYAAACHKLPYLLREAGLQQTLGFLQAKDKPWSTALREDFGAVLGIETNDARGASNLSYIHASRRAALAAAWFKKIVQVDWGVAETSGEVDDGS